jgi:hypothetical protein
MAYRIRHRRIDFTMEAIATQLGVSQSTIRDDLKGLVVTTKPPRPNTPPTSKWIGLAST